jgi:hypothetical protein
MRKRAAPAHGIRTLTNRRRISLGNHLLGMYVLSSPNVEGLSNLEVALRVLTALNERRPPLSSDTDALLSLSPASTRDLDEVAREVIMQELRRRRKERAPLLHYISNSLKTPSRDDDKTLKVGKMVHSISSSSNAPAVEAAQSKHAQQPPQKAELQEDTVHLSDAAKQAITGDADQSTDSR